MTAYGLFIIKNAAMLIAELINMILNSTLKYTLISLFTSCHSILISSTNTLSRICVLISSISVDRYITDIKPTTRPPATITIFFITGTDIWNIFSGIIPASLRPHIISVSRQHPPSSPRKSSASRHILAVCCLIPIVL